MKQSLTSILLSIFLFLNVSAQTVSENKDTILIVKIDPLLKKILSINGKSEVIKGSHQSVLQLTETDLTYRKQEIIKTKNRLYVHIDGTGILFEGVKDSDTTLKFTRIDNTFNVNYNITGYLFTIGEDIYILGGYGFWKSNGLLKKYNFVDKEWDIVPLSKEIFLPGSYSPGIWHDIIGNKIYILLEIPVNEAIIESDNMYSMQKKTYCLDLNTMAWIEQPMIHQKTYELLKTGHIPLQNEKGLLFSNEMNVYFLDLKKDLVLKLSDRSLAQTISRLGESDFSFLYNDSIFFKSKKTGKLDAFHLPMEKFEKESFPVYTWSIPDYVYWTGIILILISFSIFIHTRINRLPIKHLADEPIDQKMIDFSTMELALIQMLANKSRKQLKANINDLNYVLGAKDKNIGLQKKIRSDAIKSVNEKFRYLTGTMEALISIERSVSDKRYFEYYIRQENLKWLSKMIKKV